MAKVGIGLTGEDWKAGLREERIGIFELCLLLPIFSTGRLGTILSHPWA